MGARRRFVETCGSKNQVVKLLLPLVIEETLLKEGLQRLISVVREFTDINSVNYLWEIFFSQDFCCINITKTLCFRGWFD